MIDHPDPVPAPAVHPGAAGVLHPELVSPRLPTTRRRAGPDRRWRSLCEPVLNPVRRMHPPGPDRGRGDRLLGPGRPPGGRAGHPPSSDARGTVPGGCRRARGHPAGHPGVGRAWCAMDASQSALDSLRTVEFRETLRGYHRDDVDEYLEKAAVEAEGLQEQLRQAGERLRQAGRAHRPARGPARRPSPPPPHRRRRSPSSTTTPCSARCCWPRSSSTRPRPTPRPRRPRSWPTPRPGPASPRTPRPRPAGSPPRPNSVSATRSAVSRGSGASCRPTWRPWPATSRRSGTACARR